ncbi:MAG TPA: acyl-CoA dehydrogenase family protein [Polyangiales bacterium]
MRPTCGQCSGYSRSAVSCSPAGAAVRGASRHARLQRNQPPTPFGEPPGRGGVGGTGYISGEYMIERMWRDLRIARVYDGSSEVQQIVIAAQLRKGDVQTAW